MEKRATVTILLVLAAAPAVWPEEARVEVRHRLPGQGTVRLLVPRSWQVRTRAGTGPATSLEFAPSSGDDFKVLLTLVPPRPGGEGALKPTSLRGSVERAGRRALAEAVEKTVQIEELAGTDVEGFYFSLTDRDPGDSYKYATQGEARLGTVLAALTILQRVASVEVKTAGLDLLRTATLAR